jgi:hypothetical protein
MVLVTLWARDEETEPPPQAAGFVQPRPWHQDPPSWSGEFAVVVETWGTAGSYSNWYLDNFVRYVTGDTLQNVSTPSTTPGGYTCENPTPISPTVFETTWPYQRGTLLVYKAGLLQEKGADWNDNADQRTITFTSSVGTDIVRCCFYISAS